MLMSGSEIQLLLNFCQGNVFEKRLRVCQLILQEQVEALFISFCVLPTRSLNIKSRR